MLSPVTKTGHLATIANKRSRTPFIIDISMCSARCSAIQALHAIDSQKSRIHMHERVKRKNDLWPIIQIKSWCPPYGLSRLCKWQHVNERWAKNCAPNMKRVEKFKLLGLPASQRDMCTLIRKWLAFHTKSLESYRCEAAMRKLVSPWERTQQNMATISRTRIMFL